MELRLHFLGGAGTVTGSRFVVEGGGKRLLVDCGLFQGLKDLRLRNWAEFPLSPASIDAVLLTHAHLDHSGYLPILKRGGFRGPVVCSVPTRDLTRILLLDAAHIQEEDAAQANAGGWSKHSPARPLFTTAEAEAVLPHLSPLETGQWRVLWEGVRCRLSPNGHILGSCFVELDWHGQRLVFSGDLGRAAPLVMKPPQPVPRADWLIVESTYGDRRHPATPPLHELQAVVGEVLASGGSLIVPSFAVGRTQDLLYLFHQLREQNKLGNLPIYVDSPMAVDVTRLYTAFGQWHRLPERGIRDVSAGAIAVRSFTESQALLRGHHPKIVIAGAGMVTGGRVLGHLRQHLPRAEDTVLLVGFQAAGTRGRSLRDGASEVKIQGEYVPVRARVREIASLSAHADQVEILDWVKTIPAPPKGVFLVHGEPAAADALRVKLASALGWRPRVAQLGEVVELSR